MELLPFDANLTSGNPSVDLYFYTNSTEFDIVDTWSVKNYKPFPEAFNMTAMPIVEYWITIRRIPSFYDMFMVLPIGMLVVLSLFAW